MLLPNPVDPHVTQADIIIDGEHIQDIAEKTGTIHHVSIQPNDIEHTFILRLFKENGVLHGQQYPGQITFVKNGDEFEIVKVAYFEHGKLHRADGPAIIEFWNNKPTHCEYYLNHKKVKAEKYFKDPFNPKHEELFFFIMGNAG